MVITSAIFLLTILGIVIYLSMTKVDVEELHPSAEVIAEESGSESGATIPPT